MIREQVKSAQVEAMKAGDKEKLAAVRLILAKLKDRDIELRTAASVPDDDTVVVDVLQKMVKQRRESIDMFKNGGRDEGGQEDGTSSEEDEDEDEDEATTSAAPGACSRYTLIISSVTLLFQQR